MKIRTRFLLFLLPLVIGSITFVSSLLAYNWYTEIKLAFKSRLKSAVVTTAAFVKPDQADDPSLNEFLTEKLKPLEKELSISRLYFLPINSYKIPFIENDLHISQVYKSDTGESIMTGYAPIFDLKGHLTGHIAADIRVNLIEEKFKESLLLIILSAGLTILVMIGTLFMIANKISKPIQKLNHSALALAAGQYGESIPSEGPKEIVELANTLNIMSECLLENINRLRENAVLRERMYGEYECAMMLQHLMLQKNIDDCRSDAMSIKPITFFSENPRGILLNFPKSSKKHLFQVHLAEALDDGFEGMYQLLTQSSVPNDLQTRMHLTLNQETGQLSYIGTEKPLIWSIQKKQFVDFMENKTFVEPGDFFFVMNQGIKKFYKTEKNILDLLGKVLNIFAPEGLDTVNKMLQKEISFYVKRKDPQEDIHLLCFQILN